MRRRFLKDEDGAVAVEFAFILPLLLVLYMMGAELSLALSADRKVENVAMTVGDLLTQSANPTAADVEGVLRLAEPLMHPFDIGEFEITMTAVWVDAKGKATVDCSRSSKVGSRPPHAKGAPFQLPASLASMTSRTVLVTTTSYPYKPVGGYGFKTDMNLGDTSYVNPRSGARLTWGGC